MLNPSSVGRDVVLMGWVHRRRDHGGLIFIDLRDREGLVQVVFDPKRGQSTHLEAHRLRSEDVIQVQGAVALRPEGTRNAFLPTGDVEIYAGDLIVLNTSLTPPFPIEEEKDPAESLRLKYRYLDLRRPSVQKNFFLRHKMSREIRRFLDQHGFIEVETPCLTKSTPEGARDFLVPSRLNPGNFYALPQSPQLFKQILMIGGFDRYYQIVRCFRDEDLRADRQPEFTQVDIEMSFIDREEIIRLMEEMIRDLITQVKGMTLTIPFQRLTYQEAMSRFGVDKPDLRFGMELVDLSDLVGVSEFNVFREVVQRGGSVKGINVKGLAGAAPLAGVAPLADPAGLVTFTRKEIDALVAEAMALGAKGLAWMKVQPEGLEGPIAKFFSSDLLKKIKERFLGEPGDLLLFVADQTQIVNQVLGALRLSLGKRQHLIDPGQFKPLWVTDFPMFEYDESEKRLTAMHHPFTAPMAEDLPLLTTDPLRVRSRAYDMVLNGTEIGGGSIRIHQSEMQARIFQLLGIEKKEAEEKFGFLLESLKYGAPPHGGMAFGFDRLVAILAGVDSIRDVIAFPKTQKGICLMTDAPGSVDERQLKEIHIKKNL